MVARKKKATPPPEPSGPIEDQFEVDRIRSGLSVDRRAEFDAFLRLEPSWTDLRDWLRDRTGEDLPIAHIAHWHRAQFPVGAEASTLNQEFGEYDGLDIHKAARATLGFTLGFLRRIQERFINNEEEFAKLSTVQAVGMVPGMVREIRSLIQQIDQKQMAYDSMQQELGGAAFAIQELLTVHKDTALEEPIRALAPEIWRKIKLKYTGIS